MTRIFDSDLIICKEHPQFSMAQQVKIKQLDPLNAVAHGHGKNGIQLELLTFGFIRDAEQQFKRILVPRDVKRICVAFGAEWRHAWFSVFDEIKSVIQLKVDTINKALVHYQVLKGNGFSGSTQDIMYLSSTGFSCGVHEITMHCVKSHPNDKFGIVENTNVDTLTGLGKIYLYNPVFGNRYYWWKHTHNVWKGSNYHKKIEEIAWRNGDTIRMRLDCEKWTLQFFHKAENQEEVAVVDPFPIKANIKYFPVLTNGDTKSEYHHILPPSFRPKV